MLLLAISHGKSTTGGDIILDSLYENKIRDRELLKKSLFIDLLELYQEIISRELKEEKLYIFIDEIQYYNGWEMWLKKYFDKFPNRLSQNYNFYEK